MRNATLALAAGAAMLAAAAASAQTGPAAVPAATPAAAPAALPTSTDPAALLADPSRPAADRARDADRKPAAVLAFAGVKPGMRVFELDPGRGYFTRLLSLAVGPKGQVLAYVPDENVALPFKPLDTLTALAAEPGRGNVTPVHWGIANLPGEGLAGAMDMVWTSQNYHDLHNYDRTANFTALGWNRRVFVMLKPGGTYLVTDHAAATGAPAEVTHTLHRIDKAHVVQEVTAAGFVLDGESDVLANPADPHTAPVFDPAIRGHTDQFVLRFHKPG